MKKISKKTANISLKLSHFRALNQVFKKSKVKFAYQFGSTVTGGANSQSDIDIAVFLPENLSQTARFNLRLKLGAAAEKIFKKNVDLVILNDIRSLFFKYTIIREGKLIYDDGQADYADFVCRIMGEYFDFEPFLYLYNKAYVQRSIQ